MIPKECKRLAEVDFPIAVVSAHAAREKSIRHGHPSTLHLWWARRPLAACRSMLLALLLPDPGDPLCPPTFKTTARELLRHIAGCRDSEGTDISLRRALLRFIGDFANWDNAGAEGYLKAGRGLVKAAHPEEDPLVVDPFAGGGSIPLEALRLGCEAFASDLNPVACLINKVLLEDIPRHGPELAEQLREAGEKVKKAAEAELRDFYPPDADGAKPIAYLWARTVRCESSGCGAEIPLMKSFWLSKKQSRYRALRPVEPCKAPAVQFEVYTPQNADDVRAATVSRAKATCLCCEKSLTPVRVRAQLSEQHGGADVIFDANGNRIGGARLLAVVTLKDGQSGRQYRVGTDEDYKPIHVAQQRVKELVKETQPDGLSAIPDEPTPAGGGSGAGRAFSVQKYGMMKWSELFSARMLAALTYLSRIANRPGTSDHLARLLACACSRVIMSDMSCTRWNATAEKMQHTFGRQALPIVWDFAEVVPTAAAPGNWDSGYELIVDVVKCFPQDCQVGQVQLVDATAQHPLDQEGASVYFTDPPYYDAIPYSDLSDFFLVWLKRALPGYPLLRDPFDPNNKLSPKLQEAVQDETKKVDGKPKDRAFFEATMGKAFAEGRRILKDDGIGCVVFAHKTTEGWEALLSGLIAGGWTITGSWPISTEMATRLRARESAALATSVHLVCRPRSPDAPDGEWDNVLRELPRRIAEWMTRLQQEGVRGADLVFACIGPALEVYSRYKTVFDAQDRPIPLGGDPTAIEPHERGFLAYVWEMVGKAALQEVLKGSSGSATGLEEDARLTALFLWTLQTTATKVANATDEEAEDEEEPAEDEEEDEEDTGKAKKAKGFSLPFDVVRRIAQPLGIHLEALAGRTIATAKGVVRLLPVTERAEQLLGKDGLLPVEAAPAKPKKGKKKAGSTTAPHPDMADDPVEVPVKSQKSKKVDAEAKPAPVRELTTLDRVHKAMLLQHAGETVALRSLLKEEQDRSPEFLRLANALSPLYPTGSWEKQKLDAMLQALPK